MGGKTSPDAGVAQVVQQASNVLQEATAQWENTYTQFLQALGPLVLRATKDVLGPNGYVNTVVTYSTLPLVHLSNLIIAFRCSLFPCQPLDSQSIT